MVEAANTQGTFVDGLQGFASFCESYSRDGKLESSDLEMLAGKFRDAAFVVDQLQKRAETAEVSIATLTARVAELETGLRPFASLISDDPEATSEFIWPDDRDHWTAHEQRWGRRVTTAMIRQAHALISPKDKTNG